MPSVSQANWRSSADSPGPAASVAVKSSGPRPLSARQLQAIDASLNQGQSGTISVSLHAQGNENALGFSLLFDPAKLSYTGASLGSGASGATLNVNTDAINSGQVGFALGLSAGHNFAAGLDELVKVTFQAVASATGSASVAFADEPIFREVSDAGANSLAADYMSGAILINPLPSLRISQSDQTIALAWPSWATNFVVQEADPSSASMNWTSLSVTPTITSNEYIVTLPMTGATKFYRLQKQ